jgi:hypothetical protein
VALVERPLLLAVARDARSETIDCDLWANAWWDAFEKYRKRVEELSRET